MGRTIHMLRDDFYDGGDIEVYCGRVVFEGNMGSYWQEAEIAVQTFVQWILFYNFFSPLFARRNDHFV